MECPCCSGSMVEKNYEGVIIDECSSCGGTWLDDNEISAIVSTKQIVEWPCPVECSNPQIARLLDKRKG